MGSYCHDRLADLDRTGLAKPQRIVTRNPWNRKDGQVVFLIQPKHPLPAVVMLVVFDKYEEPVSQGSGFVIGARG